MPRTRTVALATVAVVLVGVSALEALLRYRESRRDPSRRSTSHLFYRHRKRERATVRGSDHFGIVHVNRYGFRGGEISLAKPPGTTRIIAVGLSTTFDPCAEADSLTWTARLEHWLDSLAPGRRFEVLNAGTPGVELIDNLIRLQTELHAFDADVFLVYASHGVVNAQVAARFSPVDSGARWSPTPDAAPDVSPLGHWLEEHSLLYAGLANKLRRGAAPAPVPEGEWPAHVARAAATFERNLVSFVLVAKSFGSRVVMVEVAHKAGTRDAAQLTPEESAAWQRQFNVPAAVTLGAYHRFTDVWREVADSLDATFVPTSDFGIAGEEYYCPGDAIHFNAAGADRMGQRLAQALLASPRALPPN